MDLAVEIGGDIGTLEEALQKFTGTEILDGENKYQCNRCGSYERAKKKLTVLEAPNILTIALKRFQSGKFGKLSKSIRFPEILDLAPYMSRTSDKSPIYRLYGVIVHLDIMNTAFSGHYVCYVKNVQNKWFKIDDSMVKAVELESVLTKGAYMLLYARCSPRAPRLIRNSTLLCDPRKPNNPPSKSRSHPTSPWHVFPNQRSFESNRRILEDDSSSDNSSSVFSEGCSCSTDSSNPDSNSTEDYSDPFFGELGRNWDSLWKNSDSDSSSSSSSTSPSPLYSGHSPIAYSDQCSSRYPDRDRQGFWGRQPSRRGNNVEGNTILPLLYADITNQCRKFYSSSNCRETDTDRLGRANPSSAVSIRRSTSERTD